MGSPSTTASTGSAGAPRSWKGDLLAACWAGGDRAVASHRSAAALWDLPGSATRSLEIITVLGGGAHSTTVSSCTRRCALSDRDMHGRRRDPVTRRSSGRSSISPRVCSRVHRRPRDRQRAAARAHDRRRARAMLRRVGRRGRRGAQRLPRNCSPIATRADLPTESEREQMLLRVLSSSTASRARASVLDLRRRRATSSPVPILCTAISRSPSSTTAIQHHVGKRRATSATAHGGTPSPRSAGSPWSRDRRGSALRQRSRVSRSSVEIAPSRPANRRQHTRDIAR